MNRTELPSVLVTAMKPKPIQAGGWVVPSTWTGEWYTITCSECGRIGGDSFQLQATRRRKEHLALHQVGAISKGKWVKMNKEDSDKAAEEFGRLLQQP